MSIDIENMDIKIFDMFKNHWALVTAGTLDDYNSCTVSWGTMGTLWTRPGKSGSIVTVFLHPARYTREFFQKYDKFTVSFYPKECKKALAYMGSHSGRDEDKAANAGLTPVEFGGSVAFAEAELTFVCKKLYQHQMTREDLAQEIQDYYIADPKAYPLNSEGEWEAHWVFIGDVLDVEDKRK